MTTKRHILIIDDDPDIRMLLDRFLSKKGFRISEASSLREARKKLKEESFDLVLTDFRLPDGDGLEISKEIKVKDRHLPVIMITAYSDVRTAVKAVRRGIYDYITKPLLPDELLSTIQGALEPSTAIEQITGKQSRKAKGEGTGKEYIVGNSPLSKNCYKQIGIVAPTDMTVMILGETGAGKEFVAREVHRLSSRSEKPFVAIDCGALPKEIAASELFGHVKGAFTGALQDKSGCFEYADGGTLFLDEIGNLALEHQVKLLRVLQEGKVKRLGANSPIDVNVRLVVATNDDFQKMIAESSFRQDLYFRLNEFPVSLPPLRERGDDILLFAKHFMHEANVKLNRSVKRFEDKATDLMRHYPWHGNLRELKNVVKRGVLLASGDVFTADLLPPEIHTPSQYYLQQSVEPADLKEASLHAEREMIMDALRKTGNNKSKAAELLNIDRKTLYNKLKQFSKE